MLFMHDAFISSSVTSAICAHIKVSSRKITVIVEKQGWILPLHAPPPVVSLAYPYQKYVNDKILIMNEKYCMEEPRSCQDIRMCPAVACNIRGQIELAGHLCCCHIMIRQFPLIKL